MEGNRAYQKKRGVNLKAGLNSKVLSSLCQKQEQVGVQVEKDTLQLRMLDWGSAVQEIKAVI